MWTTEKNASASEQREQATEREREAKGKREREGRGTEEAVLTASQSCVRAAEGKGALQQRLLTEQTHVG